MTNLDRYTVDPDTHCWVWTGPLNKDGYAGTIKWKGSRQAPHRLMYSILVGPIPEGLEIDHLCRVRNCVNPDHMEPVTHAENTLRGFSPQANNARKTHCVNGHEFTEENTYRQNGRRRQCRACNAAAVRRYKERRAA